MSNTNKERAKLIKKISENIDDLQEKINRINDKNCDLSSKFQRTKNYYDRLIEKAEEKHKIKIQTLEDLKNKSIETYEDNKTKLENKKAQLRQLQNTEIEHLRNQEKLAKLLD